MPEFAVEKRNAVSLPARRPRLSMHAAKCSICRHPQRAEIESDFLDWVGAWTIVREYGLGSHTAVYRHAHAFGLFARRDRCARIALGRLIEQVDDVKPTAASIVSAIRLLAKLTSQNESGDEIESIEGGDLPEVPPPAASAGDALAEELPQEASLAGSAPVVARVPSPRPNPPVRETEASGAPSPRDLGADVNLPAAAAPAARQVQAQARGPESKPAGAVTRAKPAPSSGNAGNKRRAPEDEDEDSAVAFAANAGPRRKFLWR